MRVRILRQESPETESFWEAFAYDGPEDNTVAGLLDYLNYHDDIRDETGRKTTRISWDCSCLQGVCGACAMVINEEPALACETFLKNLKGKEISIRPLRKFPVIRDLIVDRSSIQENLIKTNVYIGEYQPEEAADETAAARNHAHQYSAAKCLKCGLCLEVCPNYVDGRSFFGAAFANDCYLVSSRNRIKTKEIRELYGKHFGSVCSKSLSCMEVCPMHIPTLASMAKMNRQR
ncbi:MAG: 4Fe-4S dicluster domain-containing protein [Blautia sp.]|nr:4Fe-4S dicluster domain-containing protein [Blautia sp.]